MKKLFPLIVVFSLLISLPALAVIDNASTSSTTVPLVGGDRDAHGCIGSAGYSWCAAKNKCLRVWEEKCVATSTIIMPGSDRDAHGCIGSAGYSWCAAKNKCLRIWEEKCVAISTITYDNKHFGFKLVLPDKWKKYSVKTTVIKHGWKVRIRNPKWTKAKQYEDIPVLVYPIKQWKKWEANKFKNYPTAAPFGPTERGRNAKYVFATAPRYNYDYKTGWEEVETIIKTLKAYPEVKKVKASK
jgi:hypothetical protein